MDGIEGMGLRGWDSRKVTKISREGEVDSARRRPAFISIGGSSVCLGVTVAEIWGRRYTLFMPKGETGSVGE